MRTTAIFALVATLIASLILGGCGGGSGASAPLTAAAQQVALPAGMQELLDSFPSLPEGRSFEPFKITSAWDKDYPGSAAVDYSAAWVNIVSPVAEFRPDPGQLAWAAYQFYGSPEDVLDSVEYTVSNRTPDGLVWVAISDYDSGSWRYFDATNADNAAHNIGGGAGQYCSPGGHTYVTLFSYDEVDFDLNEVRLVYANRYSVSGQVTDISGVGKGGVLVSTTVGGQQEYTAADGTFTLPAMPDGTWHLMTTYTGWLSADNPLEFTVSGAPVTGLHVTIIPNYSHYKLSDTLEPNNEWWQAPTCNPADPIEAFISASDDPVDYYRFVLTNPGAHWFRFDGQHTALFPRLQLLSAEGDSIKYSSTAGSGVLFIGIDLAAPRELILQVTCDGGGGQYTLTHGLGNLNSLSGTITDAGHAHGYVKVLLQNAEDTTYTYTAYFTGDYTNSYLRPVATDVTPDPDSEDAWTYAPPTQNINLSMGDATNVDFFATALTADNYEPNDDTATAHAFALPVTSHDPVTISATDHYDYYKVTPTAGNYLIVRVDYQWYDYGDSWTQPMHVDIRDSALNWVGSDGYKTTTGIEQRSTVACDGNDYYIAVYTWGSDDRTFQYSLTIEEFTGYHLDVGCLWDGSGIQNARIDLYSETYGWMISGLDEWFMNTQDNGRTNIEFAFMDGETVYAELFRYGLSCHRHAAEITINGQDKLHWFEADDTSKDSNEPNNSSGISKYLSDYQQPFTATLDGDNDWEDHYRFDAVSADPLHVVFTALNPANSTHFDATLYRQSDGTTIDNFSWIGSANFMLETVGMEQHRLALGCWDGQGEYELALSHAPAYSITGTVLDGGAVPVDYSYIYCVERDYSVQSNWWGTGEYDLGTFAPGTYHLICYSPNYASTPASPHEVVITNSDVVLNFTMNPAPNDNYEPNDTFGTAHAITSGTPYNANVQPADDYSDYYTFTAAGPGPLMAQITFEHWAGPCYLKLYDAAQTEIASSTTGESYNRIDYLLPVAGIYYLQVASGGNEYEMTATY